MTVTVLLFAAASELIGQSCIEVNLEKEATVGDLRDRLQQIYPDLTKLMSSSNWSVNQSYVTLDYQLSDGCEVGVIVPVSGG